MTRTRWMIIPISLTLGLGALTACSGSSTSTSSSSSSTAAAGASSSSSAAGQDSGSVAGSQLAQRMVTALEKAKTMRVTSVSSGTKSVSEVVYDGNKASSSATMTTTAGDLQIISIDNSAEVYLKSAAMQIPTWTKVEAGSSNAVIKSMASMLSSMKGATDPAAAIKVYDAAGDFTVEGKETVDGVSTTKYSGSVPMSAILSLLSGSMASAVPTTENTPVQVTMNLDSQDRPIKTYQKVSISSTTSETTTTYSDYGADISVSAPKIGS